MCDFHECVCRTVVLPSPEPLDVVSFTLRLEARQAKQLRELVGRRCVVSSSRGIITSVRTVEGEPRQSITFSQPQPAAVTTPQI